MSYRIDQMPYEIIGEIAYLTSSISDAVSLSKTCKAVRFAINQYCMPRLYSDCIRFAYNDPCLSYYCDRVLEGSYFTGKTIDQLCNPKQGGIQIKILFLKHLQMELSSEALSSACGKMILKNGNKKNISINHLSKIAAKIPPRKAIELNLFFIIVCQNLYHYLESTSSNELEKDLGREVLTIEQIEKLAGECDIGLEKINLRLIHAMLLSEDFKTFYQSIPIILEYAKKVSLFLKSAEIQHLIKNVKDMIFKFEETDHPLGVVPKEISYFSSLERLDLSGSNLETLPDEFEHLKKLNYLILKDNLFETIPQVLDRLPQLEIVSLSDNQFDEDYIDKELDNPDLSQWKQEALQELWQFE